MRGIAKGVSYISHPLIMSLFGLGLLFQLETKSPTLYQTDALFAFPWEAKKSIFQIAVILLFIAPMISIIIMRYNKMIKSFEMETREERTYPLVITFIYYLIIFGFLYYQLTPPLNHPALLGYLLGMVIVLLLCLIFNEIWMKISLHAVAANAVLGALIGYSQTQLPVDSSNFLIPNFYWIIVLAFFTGIIGFSRLLLKAHSLREILAGTLVGFCVLYFTVRFGGIFLAL